MESFCFLTEQALQFPTSQKVSLGPSLQKGPGNERASAGQILRPLHQTLATSREHQLPHGDKPSALRPQLERHL